MGMFLDAMNQPTNMTLAIMLVIIIVLALFSTIFSGVGMKKVDGMMDNDGPLTSGASLRFVARSGQTGLGREGVERFLGRPEAPVFYQLGDTELTRSDRIKEKVDKAGFEGLNTNDPLRWDRMGFTDKDLAGY